MAVEITTTVLDEAVKKVAAHLPARLRTLPDWRISTEANLWRELVASILGSAVSFEHALRALLALESAGLTKPPVSTTQYQEAVEVRLRTAGYRFPRRRAVHVAETARRVYGTGKNLRTLLIEWKDSKDARRELVALCMGIGPKQASLFLRNIGYDELAVLDRHVLAYLQRRSSLGERFAATSSLDKYECLEEITRENAKRLSLSVAEFDLAVWVTMRVVNGVQHQWDS